MLRLAYWMWVTCVSGTANAVAQLGARQGQLEWLVDAAKLAPEESVFTTCKQAKKQTVLLQPELAELRNAADCDIVTKITVRFEQAVAPELAGRLIDEFLIDRFEWQVKQEPYSFLESDATAELVKIPMKDIQAVGSFIRQRQFPQKCSERQILTVKDGMRFWGSMAGAHADAFYKGIVRANNPPILQPYFDGPCCL
jgi:hypothetical protein